MHTSRSTAAIGTAFVVGITFGALAMRTRDKEIYGSIFYHTKLHADSADFYDDRGQVIKRLYFGPDGTLFLAKEFDEHGKNLSVQFFEYGTPQEKVMLEHLGD